MDPHEAAEKYGDYLDSLAPAWYQRALDGEIDPPCGLRPNGKPRTGVPLLDSTPMRPSEMDLPAGLIRRPLGW